MSRSCLDGSRRAVQTPRVCTAKTSVRKLVPFAGKHSAKSAGMTQAPGTGNTMPNVRRNFRRAVLAVAERLRNINRPLKGVTQQDLFDYTEDAQGVQMMFAVMRLMELRSGYCDAWLRPEVPRDANSSGLGRVSRVKRDCDQQFFYPLFGQSDG